MAVRSLLGRCQAGLGCVGRQRKQQSLRPHLRAALRQELALPWSAGHRIFEETCLSEMVWWAEVGSGWPNHTPYAICFLWWQRNVRQREAINESSDGQAARTHTPATLTNMPDTNHLPQRVSCCFVNLVLCFQHKCWCLCALFF